MTSNEGWLSSRSNWCRETFIDLCFTPLCGGKQQIPIFGLLEKRNGWLVWTTVIKYLQTTVQLLSLLLRLQLVGRSVGWLVTVFDKCSAKNLSSSSIEDSDQLMFG